MAQHDGAHEGHGDWGWVVGCGWVGTLPGGYQRYGVPPREGVGMHNIGTWSLGLRLRVLGLFGGTFDAVVAVVVGSVWDWIWKILHSV